MRTGRIGSCLINTKPCEYVSASWITNFCNYLSETQCTIESTKIGTNNILRQHDEAIMERFSTLPICTKHLKILNNVRTFLKVTLISKISTNQGDKIHQTYTESSPHKRRPHYSGKSKLLWVPQPPPTSRMWRIWIKYLRQLCKPASWILLKQLGTWEPNHSNQREWYGQYKANKIYTTQETWEMSRQTYSKIT
jgi:hypothetical protein